MQQFRENNLQIGELELVCCCLHRWMRRYRRVHLHYFNFLFINPHSPTATAQLVLFFTNSSVSPRSPPNSSPCESLPPPPSTRAALGDFGCFPFAYGDGVQIVPEQPRRPQDHPLLGPYRQLGLRRRGFG